MNRPPIPPEGLDPVIKRQLETSLHGQYEFAARTVWMGWIFTLIPIGIALLFIGPAIRALEQNNTQTGALFLIGSGVCLLVAYAMWVSHQVQKKLSKQYRADMAAQSED